MTRKYFRDIFSFKSTLRKSIRNFSQNSPLDPTKFFFSFRSIDEWFSFRLTISSSWPLLVGTNFSLSSKISFDLFRRKNLFSVESQFSSIELITKERFVTIDLKSRQLFLTGTILSFFFIREENFISWGDDSMSSRENQLEKTIQCDKPSMNWKQTVKIRHSKLFSHSDFT